MIDRWMKIQPVAAATRFLSGGLVMALVMLAVGPLPAAGTEVPSTLAPADQEPAAPDLRITGDEVHMTLEDAIAVALQRNLGLNVQRYNVAEADFGLMLNQSIFDTTLTGLVSSSSETSPAASNLSGADVQESKNQTWNAGVSQLVPYGGTLSAAWNNSRSETNSRFATLNPAYSVNLDVTYVQPLLRDRGTEITKRNIRISRTNQEISQQNFEAQVITTVSQVEDAYWQLQDALEQAKVAQESLDLAKKLHDQNRIRVEVGTLAPLELVQSEAGVATREEELIRANALIGDRSDALRQLLNLPAGELWQLTLVPETPPEMTPVPLDVDADLESALAQRTEVRTKLLSIRNQEVEAAYRRNQTKPRLDLTVTYGYNGLGGDVTERDFFTGEVLFTAPGGYDDALRQVLERDFDGWRAALSFAYPIQNRFAKAQRAIADVSLDRGKAELADLELQVTTQVRRLYRAVETSAQVIESATVSQRLAEKNLDAEQKRYDNGMSTSFQVLQIQEDLTQARSRLATAKTSYRRALVLYYQAAGRLLAETGVEIVGGSGA